MVRDWLIKCRTEFKFTHQDVANASGIGRAYYTQIELGVRNPSPKVAKQIAKKLNFEWPLFFKEECSVKRQKEDEAHNTVNSGKMSA